MKNLVLFVLITFSLCSYSQEYLGMALSEKDIEEFIREEQSKKNEYLNSFTVYTLFVTEIEENIFYTLGAINSCEEIMQLNTANYFNLHDNIIIVRFDDNDLMKYINSFNLKTLDGEDLVRIGQKLYPSCIGEISGSNIGWVIRCNDQEQFINKYNNENDIPVELLIGSPFGMWKDIKIDSFQID